MICVRGIVDLNLFSKKKPMSSSGKPKADDSEMKVNTICVSKCNRNLFNNADSRCREH